MAIILIILMRLQFDLCIVKIEYVKLFELGQRAIFFAVAAAESIES